MWRHLGPELRLLKGWGLQMMQSPYLLLSIMLTRNYNAYERHSLWKAVPEQKNLHNSVRRVLKCGMSLNLGLVYVPLRLCWEACNSCFEMQTSQDQGNMARAIPAKIKVCDMYSCFCAKDNTCPFKTGCKQMLCALNSLMNVILCCAVVIDQDFWDAKLDSLPLQLLFAL